MARKKPKAKRPKATPRKRAPKAPELTQEVKEHFAEGLLTRGEAVPEPPAGAELPPGATHTYAPEEGEVPSPKAIRRRRFSLI